VAPAKSKPKKKKAAEPEQVLRVFEKRRADGTYAFSDEEVQELVPLLFLMSASGTRFQKLPAPLQKSLVAFGVKLGITPRAKPAEIQAAIDAYYAENPPNPRLLKELASLFTK
jgi:hypothetical protein